MVSSACKYMVYVYLIRLENETGCNFIKQIRKKRSRLKHCHDLIWVLLNYPPMVLFQETHAYLSTESYCMSDH